MKILPRDEIVIKTAEDEDIKERHLVFVIDEEFCLSLDFARIDLAEKFGLIEGRPQMAGAPV